MSPLESREGMVGTAQVSNMSGGFPRRLRGASIPLLD